MQRLPLIVKATKDWSRKSSRTASGAALHLIAFLLVGLVFAVGCSDSETPGEPAAERVEAVADDDATSSTLDSLEMGGEDRSVAQKIDDASLAADVQLALVDDGDLRAFRLETATVDGRVVLQGSVETLAQRERAESVAAGIEGVRGVINEIDSTEEPLIAEEREETDSEDSASVGAHEDTAGASVASAEAQSESADEDAEESEATYHTVESGDNLWDIARTYDVSVDQIRRLNNLGSSSLSPGQRLQVK